MRRTLLVVCLAVAPVALAQVPPDEAAMRALVDGIVRGDATALRHATHVVSRRPGGRGGRAVRDPHRALAWLADAVYVPQGARVADDGTTSWWTCDATTLLCTARQPGGDTVLVLRRARGAWELVAIVEDEP